jgi:hypothetical protein
MSTLATRNESSPFIAIAKTIAIGVAGSALIMGTVAGYGFAHVYGQEPHPWVSVHHGHCGAYDLAVATPLGMLRARVAP